jgi:hypothetical protein
MGRADMHKVDAADLLDALEGVAYLVRPDGHIAACGPRNWHAFAAANGGAAIAEPDKVIGGNLFDNIEGDDVIAFYRGCMSRIASGAIGEITLPFRCDSPDTRRELRLSMRPVSRQGTIAAILFQSLPISETIRPPIELFDSQRRAEAMRSDSRLPIIVLCSFCHAVRDPRAPQAARRWITPETYYREGGTAAVRVSHGLCPDCRPQMG